MAGRKYLRYSMAFQQKVVSEIESGQLSMYAANKLYGIKGSETIKTWIKKLGKNDLLGKVVRIEMKEEKDIIGELKQEIKDREKEKKALESALAQSQLKVITLESTIEVAEEQGYLKKKNGGVK